MRARARDVVSDDVVSDDDRVVVVSDDRGRERRAHRRDARTIARASATRVVDVDVQVDIYEGDDARDAAVRRGIARVRVDRDVWRARRDGGARAHDDEVGPEGLDADAGVARIVATSERQRCAHDGEENHSGEEDKNKTVFELERAVSSHGKWEEDFTSAQGKATQEFREEPETTARVARDDVGARIVVRTDA